MIPVKSALMPLSSRSSHEERGLKSEPVAVSVFVVSRSSHEERGLKFHLLDSCHNRHDVAPRMRSVD